MTYKNIPASQIGVGKPVTEELMSTIRDNIDDTHVRINTISLAVGSPIFLNELVLKPRDVMPIGAITFASLSSAQFGAETDAGEWVAADGSNVAGSDWAALTGRSVLPDVRGRFLRAKDNAAGNSTVDPALDAYTADTLKSHDHDMSHGHGNSFGLTGTTSFASTTHKHTMQHNHRWGYQDSSGHLMSYNTSLAITQVARGDVYFASVSDTSFAAFTRSGPGQNYHTTGAFDASGGINGSALPLTGTPDGTATVGFSGGVSGITSSTGPAGASETAPRYVTENVFIKINRAYITPNSTKFVLKVPQRVTLNNIIVSPVGQGLSGNFVKMKSLHLFVSGDY
ncbi:MAG: hypothetical protein EOP06_02370 [Proteobacteria bacterium]|nr:MAG: hypothetical protein EOP06_02370 [Pseudomonadota bacterium]